MSYETRTSKAYAQAFCDKLNEFLVKYPGEHLAFDSHDDFLQLLAYDGGVAQDVFLVLDRLGDHYKWHIPLASMTQNGEAPWTLKELSRFFTNPNPDRKMYWVLREQYRNCDWISTMGWW